MDRDGTGGNRSWRNKQTPEEEIRWSGSSKADNQGKGGPGEDMLKPRENLSSSCGLPFVVYFDPFVK